jgi:hypothetical protein
MENQNNYSDSICLKVLIDFEKKGTSLDIIQVLKLKRMIELIYNYFVRTIEIRVNSKPIKLKEKNSLQFSENEYTETNCKYNLLIVESIYFKVTGKPFNIMDYLYSLILTDLK